MLCTRCHVFVGHDERSQACAPAGGIRTIRFRKRRHYETDSIMGDGVLACFSMCLTKKHDFLGTDIRSYSAYTNILQQWNTYFETRLQRYVVCFYLAFTALFNRDRYTGSPFPETSALSPYSSPLHPVGTTAVEFIYLKIMEQHYIFYLPVLNKSRSTV